MSGGETQNLVLKSMQEFFLKVPLLKKILEFQNQKKAMKFVQKENFKPKMKPMIEILQNKLYQLEEKQAKGAKLRANIRRNLDG